MGAFPYVLCLMGKKNWFSSIRFFVAVLFLIIYDDFRDSVSLFPDGVVHGSEPKRHAKTSEYADDILFATPSEW